MAVSARILLPLSCVAACMAVSACSPAANIRASTVRVIPAGIPRADPTQWWQQAFNDPLLSALIREALQANPDMTTAQANLRIARAQRSIASADLLPSLSGSGSANRAASNASYSATLDASWEADLFGSNRLAAKAADADLQASQANLDALKVSLAAEVASSYVNLRLAQARLAISRQSLASRTETVSLTTLKQQAGLASALELTQANLSLGQVQAQIPALVNSLIQSRHALAVLTGKPPPALNARLQAHKPIPRAALKRLGNIPANALRQRPDLRAAEYGILAAKLRVKAANADRYPSLRLGGALNANDRNLSDLLDAASITRSLLASVSAPLFDAGRLRQQVEIRDANRQQALAQYQKTLLGALHDVANAFSSLNAVRQQQPLLAHNVQLARSAEHLAQLSYDAGMVDFPNVLDAQRAVLGAQDSLLSAQAEQAQAVISLYKAIGGTW